MWNEEALLASKEIILCESIIDALTFWCAEFRNVTATDGVNGFSEDHKAAFARHGVRNMWIAYDRDEAGDTAAEPKVMDVNDYARTGESLAVLLNRAEWWESLRKRLKKKHLFFL